MLEAGKCQVCPVGKDRVDRMRERRMRPGTTQSGRGSSGCARSHWPLIPNHRPECDVWCCSGVLCGDVEKVCASRGPRVSIRSTDPVPLADCSRSYSYLNMFAILFHKPLASFAFPASFSRLIPPRDFCNLPLFAKEWKKGSRLSDSRRCFSAFYGNVANFWLYSRVLVA